MIIRAIIIVRGDIILKKLEMLGCMMMASAIGVGTYVLMNKNTKAKADKLLNNILDKANEMTK